MAHKTHSFKQHVVFLNPGPSRVLSCTVIWECRCNETRNVEYVFRKPTGRSTKVTEDQRYNAEVSAGKARWPSNSTS